MAESADSHGHEHTHDAGPHEHGRGHEHEHNHDHEHLHSSTPTYGFRCTLCKQAIGHPLTPADLGLAEGEQFQVGKLYRYDKCYCGFGKFVQCEADYIDPAELHRHLSEHMAH